MSGSFTRRNPTDGTLLHGRVLAAPSRARASLAIVHGLGEHGGRYAPVADALAARGLAVVSLDLHGHGRTPGRRGHIAHYRRLHEDVDLLVAETRARYPDIPLSLWGHSMGGGLVLDYMLDSGLNGGAGEVSGVIATAPALRPVELPNRFALALLRLIARVYPAFGLDKGINPDKISTRARERARYHDDPLVHGRVGVRLGLGIIDAGRRALASAARFPVPVLLLHGRGDRLTDFAASAAFAEACPRCNFHPFADVEHELHNDTSRGRVVELIDAFTRSVAKVS